MKRLFCMTTALALSLLLLTGCSVAQDVVRRFTQDKGSGQTEQTQSAPSAQPTAPVSQEQPDPLPGAAPATEPKDSAPQGDSLLDLPTAGETTPQEPQPGGEPVPREPTQDTGKTDEEMRQRAAFYSTTEHARALDFEWFLDLILFDGESWAEEFAAAEDIDDPLLVEGGWKAYLLGNGAFDNDAERYLNAEIHSLGDVGKVTLNWWYVFFPSSGTSFEEDGSETLSGTWSDGVLYTTSALGNVTLDRFFEVNGTQYATGTLQWNSGELDYLALMRP